LAEWAQNYTAEEIFQKVQGIKSPAAPINSLENFLNSPQMEARGFLVEIDHPVAGRLKYPSCPYQFSKTPWSVERPAPLIGQHNETVLCNHLGYTKQDLVRLREAGVI